MFVSQGEDGEYENEPEAYYPFPQGAGIQRHSQIAEEPIPTSGRHCQLNMLPMEGNRRAGAQQSHLTTEAVPDVEVGRQDVLESIHEMFPSIDKELITSLSEDCSDLSELIEVMLSLSDDKVDITDGRLLGGDSRGERVHPHAHAHAQTRTHTPDGYQQPSQLADPLEHRGNSDSSERSGLVDVLRRRISSRNRDSSERQRYIELSQYDSDTFNSTNPHEGSANGGYDRN